MKKFTKEEEKFIMDNIKNIIPKLIAEKLNRNVSSIYAYIYKKGIYLGTYTHYTIEEIKILKDNYIFKSNKEIGKMLGRTHWSVKHKLENLKLKRTPDQAKIIMDKFSAGTRFEKGNLPVNTKYDGAESIRINKDGKPHYYVRVSKKIWIEKQILEWEKINGNVPKGMILWCIDKNTLNWNPSNWKLITRQESIENCRESDESIAARLACRNIELKEEILKNHKPLIETKRILIKANKEIK